MKHAHFHISTFPANSAWPNGGFSLYEIDGEEIARRIGFAPDGRVNRRDGWPGYVGTFSTMREVAAVIEDRSK